MPVKPLVFLPDSQLRLISKPVQGVDKAVRKLVDDMFATMYDAPGIGLAAIQIGVPLRLAVVDVNGLRRVQRRLMTKAWSAG